MAGRSDTRSFNINQGDSAAVLGPTRSRIRQVVIFGNSAGTFGNREYLEHGIWKFEINVAGLRR